VKGPDTRIINHCDYSFEWAISLNVPARKSGLHKKLQTCRKDTVNKVVSLFQQLLFARFCGIYLAENFPEEWTFLEILIADLSSKNVQ